jgi:Acyl-CoA reductase (LuxC)
VTQNARRRVMALVCAARTLADPNSQQGREIRESLIAQGPLSPAGVNLALCEHLELHPTESELDTLIDVAGRAPHVHVVLSANVFVGALRALALALAATTQVTVRMSRREAAFPRALVAAIDDSAVADCVSFTDSLNPGAGEEVHLYGHDTTMREIASRLPSGVLVRPHGSGMGVAVIGASADVVDAAEAIADDVVPFDQRGCLSPRIVMVEGDHERAVGVSRRLAEALDGRRTRVPVGFLDPDELAERTRYRDTCRMIGELHEVGEGSVGVARALLIPPVGRNVHVLPCGPNDAAGLLGPLTRAIATVGVAGDRRDPLVAALLSSFDRVRVSPVGKMQRPPLDGPVDRRVSGPLTPAEVVRMYG